MLSAPANNSIVQGFPLGTLLQTSPGATGAFEGRTFATFLAGREALKNQVATAAITAGSNVEAARAVAEGRLKEAKLLAKATKRQGLLNTLSSLDFSGSPARYAGDALGVASPTDLANGLTGFINSQSDLSASMDRWMVAPTVAAAKLV